MATAAARVRLRKRLGQHLLNDAGVAKRIAAAADIQPHERVFEVGPGSGNLTVHLLERAAKVCAVELDAVLHDVLLARAEALGASDKLEVVHGDVLKLPFPPRSDAMVANIPYQISSPLLGFDMQEWDAMLKRCFSGRNKTLRSLFSSKYLLAALEAQRQAVQATLRAAQANHQPETTRAAAASAAATIQKMSHLDARALILVTLDRAGLLASRANAMPVTDFFKLYHAFHQAGLWFDAGRVEAAPALMAEVDEARREAAKIGFRPV
ncbi:DIM1 [Symbiodinium sp. KB8]|nr:DIM1 [Symbiodinium sp. KB8]